MSTVTPSEPPAAPDPGHSDNGMLDILRLVLTDKAVWRRVLVLVVVVLAAGVLAVWLLAPHLGMIGAGALGATGGAVGGGTVLAARRKTRR